MDNLTELVQAGWEVRSRHFPPVIYFAYPRDTQPVSVTGDKCQLDCAHCGGHYLKHMKPLDSISPSGEELGASCLISGGCALSGTVPFARHIDRLKELKTGRRFNMHTGLVTEDEVSLLAGIADVVSFDFVGDDGTIREVFGLERSVKDYCASYRRLRENCKVMPHICIGLEGGKIKGEYRALELLGELGVDGLTFIIFTPTKNTKYANCSPPPIDETVRFLIEARKKFPVTPMSLGCMRPGGRYRGDIDQLAVSLGINKIVNPVPSAVKIAEKLKLDAVVVKECCAL